MSGEFDFLQEEQDFSSIEGTDANIQEVINQSNHNDDDTRDGDDQGSLGAPTDGVGSETIEDSGIKPKNTDDNEDDWDNFVNNAEEETIEMSDEDQAQLDLANKTVPGKNFKTIKDFQDYLNNPSGKDGSEEKKEEKVFTLDDKLEAEDKAIVQLNALIERDNEDLIRLDIKRQDPNISEDDLDLEIEDIRNAGQLNYKARELKGKLRHQISLREGKKDGFKKEEEDKKAEVQTNNRKSLQEILKQRTTMFDSIEIDENVNKEVYRRIVSGEFHKSIKDNHAEIAKLATLQVMEEKMIKAFKSLKQSGHAFEGGKHSILNKISNVKPRTQGGSNNPLEGLFDNQEGMDLKAISMDGMEFVDDKE